MLEIRRWNLWVWCCINLLEWPINRLIHRSFTQFNFKILDFTNPVKWGESGTRHGPRQNHELLMYYIQRRAFWLYACSRFGETAQLNRPLLCGDSPQKKKKKRKKADLPPHGGGRAGRLISYRYWHEKMRMGPINVARSPKRGVLVSVSTSKSFKFDSRFFEGSQKKKPWYHLIKTSLKVF